MESKNSNMDSSKTRVVDYSVCFDRVIDIVFEEELTGQSNCEEENIYHEPEHMSDCMSSTNEDEEEPIYEEMPQPVLKKYNFNRSLPVVPNYRYDTTNSTLKGRLEVVRSAGNFGSLAGIADSKASLYDKLVRTQYGSTQSQKWQSQQTLICSRCNSKLTISHSTLLHESGTSVSLRNSQLDDQNDTSAISHFTSVPRTGSYRIIGDSKILLIEDSHEDSLSTKFERIHLCKSTWTDAETIFLSFYNEGMDKLHLINGEEECNKVILLGLGLPSASVVHKLPRILQKRYRKIKEAILSACKFSLKLGILPLVYEKKSTTKFFPSYTSLKILFKVGLRNENEEFVFVDVNGKIFKNIQEWESKLKLWKYVAIYPKNGHLSMDSDGEPESVVSSSSRGRFAKSWAIHVTDITLGITGITALGVGALAVSAGATTVLLPGLLIGEAVILSYAGIRCAVIIIKNRRKKAKFKEIFIN